MVFRRSKHEKPEQAAPAAPAAPDAVLRDETGLHHLWYFEERLSQEVARSSRTDGLFSLAVWHLKLLPGEQLAGELVEKCASIICDGVRAYDLVTRIDEERFAALLLDARAEDAATVAHRIKGELQLRVSTVGRWQAGVATFQRDGVDADGLIRAALRRLDEDASAA